MIRLIIATSGRGTLLRRTLQSLSACERPADFSGVTVVENGPQGDAQAVCADCDPTGLIEYQWCETPGKNRALNQALASMDEDDFAVFSDDDVRFVPGYLNAYQATISANPEGHFFGGAFEVDYETAPPSWLLRYLPLSAKGWAPTAEQIQPDRTWFLGFNWAARVGDVKRVGGFDPDIGPGSKSNSTGDEVAMQKAMHALGIHAKLAVGAQVWHYVPAARCSPQWALDRAYRDGLSRGQYVRQTRGLRLFAGHLTQGIRYATARSKQATGLGHQTGMQQFMAAYNAQKAKGYYAAFRAA